MALKNQAGLIKIIDSIECMEKSLSCAICLEICSEPVETRCGHLFCRICIKKVLSNPGESCPVCKLNLTRRSFSSSDHMKLCIQQLSKLIDAVRSDTDIDITSCLKTHYKKRAFLPSASSSSLQSQDEIQNQISSLESDNIVEENPQNHADSSDLAKQDGESRSKESSTEYPFDKPREQTIKNSSCKIVTKKSQLESNSLRSAAINPSRVQNENILPTEKTSRSFKKSKSAETHQFGPRGNDEPDKSSEENRQCFKDISALNLNRSLTDQSSKTWSRVAKFGKELRHKYGKNSPRMHKKSKLSVNVRDKSVLLNASHDHSTDRDKSGQDRVDHDTDINISMLNRYEHDINVSVSEIKKTVGEKVNPTRLNRDDEIITKNKKQETLMAANNKVCGENIALEPHVETNERLSNSGPGISGIQIMNGPKNPVLEQQLRSDIFLSSDPPKTVIPVSNTYKRSSREKGEVPEDSPSADSGKPLFSANKEGKRLSKEKEKISEASSAADSGKSLFSANKINERLSQEKEKVSGASVKANSEKLVIPENEASKLNEKKGMHSEASSSNFDKSADTANKGSKRLSDERSKLPESLNTSAGNEAKTARAISGKINNVSDVDSHPRRTKRTQHATVAENVVPFLKLGHWFRVEKKKVTFLYLGPVKSQVSDILNGSESASICNICSSRQLSNESALLQKQPLGSLGRLNRAKYVRSASFDSQKLLPLPEISTNQINKGDKRENHFRIPSTHKEQNYLQSRTLSKDDGSQSAPTKTLGTTLPDKSESSGSSIIRRKRKRSQSSDHEEECTEEQNGKRVSKKQSKSPDCEDQCMEKQSEEQLEASDHDDQCTKNRSRKRSFHESTQAGNGKYFEIDSLLNKTLNWKPLAPKSLKTGHLPVQEKDTTDEINPPEHENVDVEPVVIDSNIKNACNEANITLRGNISRTLPTRMPATTPDVPKNVNCTEGHDSIGLEARERSSSYSAVNAQHSNVPEYEEGSEINLSRASMMDITGEELLFKKFEEQLFAPSKSDNVGNDEKRCENNKRSKKNTADSLAVENRTLMPEPLAQSVSVPKTTLIEDPALEIEDFVELTPTEQNSNRLNNPPDMARDKKSTAMQSNIETPHNSDERKTAETSVRRTLESDKAKMQTPAQSVTKIRPIYQSTPISSQVPGDRYRHTAYRQMNRNANSPIASLEHNIIPRSLKLNPPVSRRGCIVCSGLTTKQSEDVKSFSILFNMQYTKKFTDGVTHVIVKTNNENNGACKTLKYLQGVAYRKWVLNFNWIVDCLAQKKLLKEESYEVVDNTTLVAGPRKARTGEKEPFDGFVFYCVEPFQNISVSDYEDLLRQMGATVVGSLNDLAVEESIFKILAVQSECHEKKIIEWHQITKAVPVAQEWIVECISQYKLVSLLPFLQELLPQDILDLGFPEELIQEDDSDFMYDMSN